MVGKTKRMSVYSLLNRKFKGDFKMNVQHIINKMMVFLLVATQILTVGTSVVQATEIQDITAQLLDSIDISQESVRDGDKIEVTAAFSDARGKIKSGDRLSLSWPEISSATLKAYANSYPIEVDGVIIGQADIRIDGATITFSESVEQFDQGSVRGGIHFSATVRNTAEGSSTQQINIVAGNVVKEITVTKEDYTGPVGTRDFSSKAGVIYAEDPDKVFWDISLNSNNEMLVQDINMVDTIKGIGSSQALLPDTFYIEATGPSHNQTYHGVAGVQAFMADFSASFDYSNETGIIHVSIPQGTANGTSFRIAYNTQILDKSQKELYNDLNVAYQVYNEEAKQVTLNSVVENANGGAWGTGNQTGQLTIMKQNAVTKTPLPEAKFVLKDAEGSIVRDHLESDKDGKIVVKELKPGQYVLEETSAPEGFERLLESIPVNINQPEVTTVVENQPIVVLGRLIVTKVDAQTNQPLSGAAFELTSEQDGSIQKSLTNDDGVAQFEALPLGAYTLKEVTAPKGYILDSTVRPVEITGTTTEAHDTHITVKNQAEVVLGQLEVIKTDEATKERLSGAKFNLTNMETKVSYNVVTDDTGMGSVDNLPLGEYTLIETEAPKGYALDRTKRNVVIKNLQDGTNKVSVTVPNKKLIPWIPLVPSTPIGQVIVMKIDSLTGEPLEGATFKLVSLKTKVEARVVTDDKGKAVFKELPLGEYNLTEVEAPKGYILDDTTHSVVVEKNEITGNRTEITLLNDAKKPVTPEEPEKEVGSLQINKISRQTKEGLQGATFKLVSKETGQVYTVTTDDKGHGVINDLPLGDYGLTEVEAPKGYDLDSDRKDIEIIKDKALNNRTLITIENTKSMPWIPLVPSTPVGQVIISKIDGMTGELLPNARFDLVSVETGDTQTVTTDEQGKAHIKNVPVGLYTLKEVEAPKGYRLDGTLHQVTVVKNADKKNVTEVTMMNEPEFPWVPIEPNHKVGNIRIIKQATGTKERLAKAEFKLISKETGHEYTMVTDANGEGIIKELPVGAYALEETKAPRGYVLDKTIRDIEISESIDGNSTVTVEVDNTPEMPWVPIEPSKEVGSLEITKTDSVTGRVLPGASFSLVSNTTSTEYTMTTDREGKAVMKGLPLGDYQLIETKAPKGYVLDKTATSITIASNKATENKNTVAITNEPELPLTPLEPSVEVGTLILTKIDSETGVHLSGAEFKLTSEKTGRNYHLVTDTSGTAMIKGLPLGMYQLEETNAPTGYVLDNTPKAIEITSHKELNNETHVTMSNELASEKIPVEPSVAIGRLQINKVDEQTKEVLSGAVFTVTSKETGESYEVTTNDQGQAEVSALELGDYEIVEILAPKGYVLDRSIQTVSVVKNDEDEHMTTVTIENKRKEKQELPEVEVKPNKPKPTEQTKGDKITREPLVNHHYQKIMNQKVEGMKGNSNLQNQHQSTQQEKGAKGTRLPQTGEKVEPFVALGLLLMAAVGLIAGYRYFDKKHLN